MAESLKPVDILVALGLVHHPDATYDQLGADLGISASWTYESVKRLRASGLVRPDSRAVNKLALREFLEHGIRYAFPARPGPELRGVPTAHSGPSLSGKIISEDAVVWPSAKGTVVGREITPLHPGAIELPERSPAVYESLTLVDALRAGRARERKLAAEELARRLQVA